MNYRLASNGVFEARAKISISGLISYSDHTTSDYGEASGSGCFN
jgi:hypothetical protein